MSNRYLTPLKDMSALVESVPFHKGVDPRNILRDMAKNNHIHTEDNYVGYFSMHRDSNGQRRSITKLSKVDKRNSLLFWIHRFQACEPQVFRVGDIVQVQLSFVVIPVKGGRRKMLTVLRSLALLDESFTNNLVSLLKTIQCHNVNSIRQLEGGKSEHDHANRITHFKAQSRIQLERHRSSVWWGKEE